MRGRFVKRAIIRLNQRTILRIIERRRIKDI